MKKILLAIILLILGINLSAEKVKSYKETCINVDMEKHLNLGISYLKGQGVPQDDFKAAKLLKKSCDGGCGLGCVALGVMYEKGLGLRQDDIQAMELYKKGCNSGVIQGCNNFIYNSIEGDNLSKTEKKFLKEICDDGSGYMCTNVGMVYENGMGAEQNDSIAVEFYTKGCHNNDSNGCYLLGRMYKEGRGIKQNHSKAKELFGKACDGGDADGCQEYAKLNKK